MASILDINFKIKRKYSDNYTEDTPIKWQVKLRSYFIRER